MHMLNICITCRDSFSMMSNLVFWDQSLILEATLTEQQLTLSDHKEDIHRTRIANKSLQVSTMFFNCLS